ncbi:TIGR04255 family protein [Streptacidiphilus sp. PAMC 29251]
MPIEAAEPNSPAFQPFHQLNLLSPGSRYWLTSDDGSEVLQVQSDYLALNWKRGEGHIPYSRYESVRERFAAFLNETDRGLVQVGEGVRPLRAELTYVNLIEPNGIWPRMSDGHKLFTLSPESIGDYEQFSFTFSRALIADSETYGRLHVGMNPMQDWAKAEPLWNFTITARSLPFADESIGSALLFLDRAHEAANKAFRQTVTNEALRLWGLQ